MFAACLLKNTERASHLLPFRYERAEVNVAARRQESPPRVVAINSVPRLGANEPGNRVELLHRNRRRSGTVHDTLGAACTINN